MRSKARAMAEDQARFERLEKVNQKLQEKYTKSCDDISQMMEMMKMLTRKKQNTETPNPQAEATPLKSTGEDTLYPQGFVFSRETQATYASPSQAFPLNYGLPQVMNTPGLVLHEPKTSAGLMDPLAVSDLDELAGKGKSLQDKVLEKYELLEERMRAMEGIDILGSLDATELSLMLGLVIPHKFKTPTFDKYDGTKCPTTHLTMYCRKMSAYIDNDKLLIYCFQDSLIGVTT